MFFLFYFILIDVIIKTLFNNQDLKMYIFFFFWTVGWLGALPNLQEEFKRGESDFGWSYDRAKPQFVFIVFVPIRRRSRFNTSYEQQVSQHSNHQIRGDIHRWRSKGWHTKIRFRELRLGEYGCIRFKWSAQHQQHPEFDFHWSNIQHAELRNPKSKNGEFKLLISTKLHEHNWPVCYSVPGPTKQLGL